METLFVRYNQEQNLAHWVVLDENGNPYASIQQGSLSAVKSHSRQRKVVLAMPSTDIYLDAVTLPASRNRRKFQQAVPFALEEELAEDLETLHFALGKENTINSVDENEQTIKQVELPVAVIKKDILEETLDTFADAGIKPNAVVPDVLTVPLNSMEWSIFIGGNVALIRTGTVNGFACDVSNLPAMLDNTFSNLSASELPKHIRVWNHNDSAPTLTAPSDTEIDVTDIQQPGLSTLANGFRLDESINLLQGDFNYQQEYGKLFKPWRLPALLLAILALLAFSTVLVDLVTLQKQEKELSKQLVDTYKSVFPNARNIIKPRFQMEQKLQELGGAGGTESALFTLLNAALPEIQASAGSKITAINFSNQRLDIELSVKNLQNLDAIKSKLDQKSAIVSEIDSASAEGNKVSGRLKITPR